VVPMV